MRKRRKSVRKREGEDRSVPAAPTEHDGATEERTGLEDDGFVFWPTTLGDPAGPRLVQVGPRPPREPDKATPPRRRLATVLFTLLFFAGAALTAAAGNEVATIVSSSPEATALETQTTDTTATETTTTTGATTTTTTTTAESSTTTTTSSSEPAPITPAPTTDETTTAATTTAAAPIDDQPGGGGDAPQTTTTTAVSTTPASLPAGDPATSTGSDGSQSAPAADLKPQPEAQPAQLLEPQTAATLPGHKRVKQAKASYASLHKAPKPGEIEPEGDGSATGNVRWINQPLPDPTPASLRLSREFAQQLRAASSAEGLDWAFLLAVLRTERLHSSGEV